MRAAVSHLAACTTGTAARRNNPGAAVVVPSVPAASRPAHRYATH